MVTFATCQYLSHVVVGGRGGVRSHGTCLSVKESSLTVSRIGIQGRNPVCGASEWCGAYGPKHTHRISNLFRIFTNAVTSDTEPGRVQRKEEGELYGDMEPHHPSHLHKLGKALVLGVPYGAVIGGSAVTTGSPTNLVMQGAADE